MECQASGKSTRKPLHAPVGFSEFPCLYEHFLLNTYMHALNLFPHGTNMGFALFLRK